MDYQAIRQALFPQREDYGKPLINAMTGSFQVGGPVNELPHRVQGMREMVDPTVYGPKAYGELQNAMNQYYQNKSDVNGVPENRRVLANAILAAELAPAAMDVAGMSPIGPGKALGALSALPLGAMGKIVYHGSPHRFNRFSHKMMGSGEGAQAYGWGTYLAEKPGVADSYRAALSGQKWKMADGSVMDDTQAGYEIAADIVDTFPDDFDSYYNATPLAHDALSLRRQGLSYGDAIKSVGDDKYRKIAVDGAYNKFNDFDAGNLYEVDLPDEHIEKMLDWDAPLSEQPEGVRKAFADVTGLTGTKLQAREISTTGRDFYMNLSSQKAGGQDVWRHGSTKLNDRAASEALSELGIPGIKYFDGGSRAAGSGTRNYVVFDENLMEILKRNNEALTNTIGK